MQHEAARRELGEHDALGNVAIQLFPDYGEFFGVPRSVLPGSFELLSVFVKDGRSTWRFVGDLKPDGLLADDSVNLLRRLMPHLHSSSKRVVNTYLVGKKRPFAGQCTEFSVQELCGRPEGKYFSWLDMGATQVEYVNQSKLTTALQGLKIDLQRLKLQREECIYVIHQVSSEGSKVGAKIETLATQ